MSIVNHNCNKGLQLSGSNEKYTNIGIYVRYSENMDTWKMSENANLKK